MKKIILSVLCVVLVALVFAACGRGNVGDYTTHPSTSTTTKTTTSRTTTENKTTTDMLTTTSTSVATTSNNG